MFDGIVLDTNDGVTYSRKNIQTARTSKHVFHPDSSDNLYLYLQS